MTVICQNSILKYCLSLIYCGLNITSIYLFTCHVNGTGKQSTPLTQHVYIKVLYEHVLANLVVALSFMDPVSRLSCLLFCFFCSLPVICGEGTGLLALLCVMFSCVFCYFPIWCPGSGVVLDCFDF